MRKMMTMLCVLCVVAVAGSAWGATYRPLYDWTAAADGDWETAGNWTETLATGQSYDPPNSPPPFRRYRFDTGSGFDYIDARAYIENGYTVTAGDTFSVHRWVNRIVSPGGQVYIGDATGNSKLVIDIGNAIEKTFYGMQSYVGYTNGAGSIELKSGNLNFTGTNNRIYVGANGYTGTYTQTGGEYKFYGLNVGTYNANANGTAIISGGHMYNSDSREGITVGSPGRGSFGTGLFHVQGSWDWDYGSGPEAARIDLAGDFTLAYDNYGSKVPDKDSTLWFEFDTNSPPAVTKIIAADDILFGYNDNGTPNDLSDDKGALLKLGWETGATPTAFTDYLVMSGDAIIDDGLRLHPDTAAGWSFTVIPGTDDGAAGDGQLLVSYVPEPATMTFLGLGALGALLRRRRR